MGISFSGPELTAEEKAKAEKEQIKEDRKEMRRNITRTGTEIRKLEEANKRLRAEMMQIFKTSKLGKEDPTFKAKCKSYKQAEMHVQSLNKMKTTLEGFALQHSTMESTSTMNNAMQRQIAIMKRMNEKMNTSETVEQVREFNRLNEMMSNQQEVLTDAIDDATNIDESSLDSAANEIAQEFELEISMKSGSSAPIKGGGVQQMNLVSTAPVAVAMGGGGGGGGGGQVRQQPSPSAPPPSSSSSSTQSHPPSNGGSGSTDVGSLSDRLANLRK
jgi:hypothetical protein